MGGVMDSGVISFDDEKKPVMCTMNYYVDGNLMETVCYQDGTEETRVVRYKVDVAE